jgi:hypothetical protein
MSKINVKGSLGQMIVHSSDGKDAALSPASGQPVTVSGSVLLKTAKISGQETGTSIVFSNPA